MATAATPAARVRVRRRPRKLRPAALARPAAVGVPVALLAALPLLFAPGSAFVEDATQALAYTMMALGLNIIVGFAGLLDFGYVVFFALGACTVGWFGSSFLALVGGGEGLHVAVGGTAASLPGIHLNFFLLLAVAVALTTAAGILIGVPTLRLRADYIAVVTLAFGEIIGRIAVNGDDIRIAELPLVGGLLGESVGAEQTLTNGRMGITPVDKIALPGLEPFRALDMRPWYWTALAMVLVALFVSFRLRGSRIGRAWAALRHDEVAAASMGVPVVRSKLLAYGIGAAFGGVAGAFLASFNNTVNADQFEMYVSVLLLAMVVLGGMGSVWGVVAGAVVLTYVNYWLIPDVINDLPRDLGFDFDAKELTFSFYGLLLVLMMILRPQGLLPERR